MWADLRRLTEVGVLAVTVGAVALHAQPGGGQLGAGITYSSGQSVQPIFEGWTKNADGSFELHFGYLNRNYVEEVSAPVGPDNTIEPGAADRGQPGYFYPRFNRRVFSVTVPRDFGKKELIWTLKLRGRVEKAVGWLHPEWEIAPPGSTAGRGGQQAKNQPPTISVPNPGPATLQSPLTLTASVTDDGVPAAAQGRGGRGGGGGRGAGAAGGAGTPDGAAGAGAGRGAAAGAGGGGGGRGRGAAPSGPPTFRRESPETTPVNVPEIVRQAPPRLPGLSVTWLVWRGTGPVVFTPQAVPVKDGQATVTAKFQTPGDYVLRARASDSAATTVSDVKVAVTDRP